jgi:O-antigen/teichoic acid export membrane protein
MTGKLSSALRNFSFSTLSSLQLFQLIRYATFVAIGIGFAKLHLALSEIGSFETFIMFSGMLSFFWVSGIINTMLSIYPKKDEIERKELLFNTFVSLVLLSVIAGIFLFIFSDSLLSFLDKKENGALIRLTVFYLLLSCPSFLTEYILFLNERKRALVSYALFFSAFTLIAALLPVVLQWGIEYSLYGMISVAALRFIIILFVLNKFAVFRFNARFLLSNLKISAPLLASIFVSGSAEYIDGMIVKAKFDDVSFAVFRYGARELPVLLIIANTMSSAMVPSIARNLSEGLTDLKKHSTRLMHFFFPLTIVLMLSSRFLYQYVFSESFIYSAFIFNIYLLLIIPRVLFPQTILTGLQHTKYLLLSSVIEIALNVSLSIWLAGKIGLPGIAIGTLIAYLFDKIFLVSVNRVVYKIHFSQYMRRGLFWIYTLATLLAFGVSYSLVAM